MNQPRQQPATVANVGEPGANLWHAAEALCRAVAGRDLGEAPLYIVPQSSLPPDCGAGDHCYGYTTPSLDLYLADHIPGYRGRGPCVVVNDIALAEEISGDALAYRTLTIILHELAHVLDRPALYEDRTGVDPNRILFESLVVANATASPPRGDIPLYYGHEVGFIRIALHLVHRAEQAGFEVRPGAVCAGYCYGLSSAYRYQLALGDEPARCTGMTFREIITTKPPQAFSSLWCDDFIAYHQRCLVQKGTLP